MKDTIQKFEQLLEQGSAYFSNTSENDLSLKPAINKWSKKEILGHLVDSAINNLQRFTEVQFQEKPFKIHTYNQDELVIANDYQNTETNEILVFWIAINRHIISLMKKQTETSLNFEIERDPGDMNDLRFLMTDYVRHIEHHLKQIIE